jgi:hypothetical protein
MANPNAPHGASPVSSVSGLSWNGTARLYNIPSTDGSAYAIGDFVKSATGSDVAGVTRVIQAAAGDVCRGVVVGIVVAPTAQQMPVTAQVPNLNLMTIPATKLSDYYVYVVDDPFIIFEIQNNNSSAMTVTSQNANFVTASLGTNTFSQSMVNNASIATTNTLQLKILGLAQRVNVDKTANAPLLVMFNTHEFKTATGTTGV